MGDVIAGIFGLLIISTIIVTLFYFVFSYSKPHRGKKQKEQEALEKKRLAECEEVVLFFANNLGYIARQCISKGELGEV